MWKSAYVQHIELQGEEMEVLREPRPGICRKTRRGIILQARYQLHRYPETGPYLLQSLIDTGSEILSGIGWELIDKKYCEAADMQFRLLRASNMELEGGKLGVRVTILPPVHTCAGVVVAQCVNAFLHLASVGPRVILGVKAKHLFKTIVRCFVVCFPRSFAPKSQILISKNSWTTDNTKDGATQ